MSEFLRAAYLNNDGIIALLNGELTNAISCMCEAIELIRSDLANSASRSSTTVVASIVREANADTVEVPSIGSTDTIVFNQAIRIPTIASSMKSEGGNKDEDEDDITSKLTDLDRRVYASTIVYNFALTNQLKASLSGDEKLIDKTEKLYCMVLKMLDHNDNDEERILLGIHTALVVKLATINNLTQIRYSKGEYENDCNTFKQVAHFVVENSSNPEMLEKPQIQELLMNVLLLKPPMVAASAA